MEQIGTILRLSDGGTVRATPYLVEIRSSADRTPMIVDRHHILSFRRTGSQVELKRDHTMITIDFASIDDAGQLETILRSSSSAGAVSIGGTDLSLLSIPIVLVGCAILMIIGSIGPWAKVWVVTVSGTNGDGMITLVLALVAAALSGLLVKTSNRRGWFAVGLCGSFLLAALVGVYDWLNLASTGSAAWGLQIMTLSAILGFALAIMHYRRQSSM